MLRRILQMLTGAIPYRNKWERMTGEPCQPPVRQERGRPWPTSPPPPKKREGEAMSEQPVQCKFCGRGCSAELQGILTFRCGSVWFHEGKKWLQFAGCERGLLKAKIGRAVEALQKAQRYDYGSTAYMEAPLQPSESGDWIAVDDVTKAIQILQEEQQ